VLAANVPTAQEEQEADAAAVAYMPAMHSVQATEPDELNLPDKHVEQVIPAAAPEYLPAAQAKHVV